MNPKDGDPPPGEEVPAPDPPPRSWPPPRTQGGKTRMNAEQQSIKTGNATLRKALAGQYKADRPSELVAEKKGLPVDGLTMWKKRLALYDEKPPDLDFSNNVPKHMGVARCSATGLYSYYGADGRKLKQHKDAPELWYDDEHFDDFVEIDSVSQRKFVEWSKGKGSVAWTPKRPASDCWVVNRHIKLGLQLMRQMVLGKGRGAGMSIEDIKQAIEEEKLREEAEAEEAAATDPAAAA